MDSCARKTLKISLKIEIISKKTLKQLVGVIVKCNYYVGGY